MGRFLLGFTVGAAIGAAVVIFTTPRSGASLRASIGETVRGAVEAAKNASTAREEQLWNDYRSRLPQ